MIPTSFTETSWLERNNTAQAMQAIAERKSRKMYPTKPIEISRLNRLLAQNSYQEIFNDRELFWQAYCVSSLSCLRYDKDFKVTLVEDILIVGGYCERLEENKKVISNVQQFFKTNFLNKKDFSIYCLENKAFSELYMFDESVSALDTKKASSFFTKYFFECIKPCLESLAALFHAKCFEKEKTKTITIRDCIGGISTSDPLEEYRIEWDKQHHYIYPISPKIIAKNEMEYSAGYQLYLNQKFCDFSIVVGPNKHDKVQHVIKLHFLPLYANGGKFIQKMFDHESKEKVEKAIHFTERSLNVIKAYINFVYLGEEGINPEYVALNNIDPVELLDFAHCYQIEPLIDCCTNLICLNSENADALNIDQLAETYENDHLKKLFKEMSKDK